MRERVEGDGGDCRRGSVAALLSGAAAASAVLRRRPPPRSESPTPESSMGFLNAAQAGRDRERGVREKSRRAHANCLSLSVPFSLFLSLSPSCSLYPTLACSLAVSRSLPRSLAPSLPPSSLQLSLPRSLLPLSRSASPPFGLCEKVNTLCPPLPSSLVLAFRSKRSRTGSGATWRRSRRSWTGTERAGGDRVGIIARRREGGKKRGGRFVTIAEGLVTSVNERKSL